MGRRRLVVITVGVLITALVAVVGVRCWNTYQHSQSTATQLIDAAQRGHDIDDAFTKKAQHRAAAIATNGRESMRVQAKAELMAAARDSHAGSLVVDHDLAALHLRAGTAMADARDAYRSHIHARIAQVSGWETDLGDRSHDAEVSATWTLAQRAVAVVALDPTERVRADAIFK